MNRKTADDWLMIEAEIENLFKSHLSRFSNILISNLHINPRNLSKPLNHLSLTFNAYSILLPNNYHNLLLYIQKFIASTAKHYC